MVKVIPQSTKKVGMDSFDAFAKSKGITGKLITATIDQAGGWKKFTLSAPHTELDLVRNGIYDLDKEDECMAFFTVNAKSIMDLIRLDSNVNFDIKEADFLHRICIYVIELVSKCYLEFLEQN